MKCHIWCSSLCLHMNNAHYTVCWWIAMAQNEKEMPLHPSSTLLRTAAEGHRVSTACYLFSFLVFSLHDMNVFLTNFTVDNVVSHMQGFSSGILIIFFEKLCVKCERILINMSLPCMVNMQHSVWESILTCGSCTRLTCSIQCGNLD